MHIGVFQAALDRFHCKRSWCEGEMSPLAFSTGMIFVHRAHPIILRRVARINAER